MSLLADLLSTVFKRRYRAVASSKDDRPLTELAEQLMGSAGEISGLALADEMLSRFQKLDDEGKLAFFAYISDAMDIEPDQLRQALDAYEKHPSKISYRAFAAAAEPRRHEFLRRLNGVPGATGQLVHMRAELLRLAGQDSRMAPLDLDFRHLFASWFNRGFLVLRPISWESPAHILEKIIAYEAVHAISSWDDLRRRLEPADRRCFAFFHPAMPDEPLIFVEVALTQGVPDSIQSLLAEDRTAIAADQANTAVFYSISNCQRGLASISFGNSLIKQVAADLASAMPELTTFVTLSPIPGLATWREQHGLTTPDQNEPEAARDVASYYLLHAKAKDGQPFDPVARFHLGNGAMVHAVHAGADLSDKGIAQSGGVMVNYLYDLSQVGANHELYVSTREVVASAEVKKQAEDGNRHLGQTSSHE
jgi:malonyl-CoA decarboxylase